MIEADLAYVRRLIACKIITGPALELGTDYEGSTSRQEIELAGLKYYSTDISKEKIRRSILLPISRSLTK